MAMVIVTVVMAMVIVVIAIVTIWWPQVLLGCLLLCSGLAALLTGLYLRFICVFFFSWILTKFILFAFNFLFFLNLTKFIFTNCLCTDQYNSGFYFQGSSREASVTGMSSVTEILAVWLNNYSWTNKFDTFAVCWYVCQQQAFWDGQNSF